MVDEKQVLGYEQGEARKLARKLGGIAVEARHNPDTGKWLTGGWAGQEGTRWIVVSIDLGTVLDDGTGRTPGSPGMVDLMLPRWAVDTVAPYLEGSDLFLKEWPDDPARRWLRLAWTERSTDLANVRLTEADERAARLLGAYVAQIGAQYPETHRAAVVIIAQINKAFESLRD